MAAIPPGAKYTTRTNNRPSTNTGWLSGTRSTAGSSAIVCEVDSSCNRLSSNT